VPTKPPANQPRARGRHAARRWPGWVRFALLPLLATLVALQPTVSRADAGWQADAPSLPTSRIEPGDASAPCPAPSTVTCLYAIDGEYENTILSDVEYYDTSTGTGGSWQSLTNSPTTARYWLGAVSGPCPGSGTTTCLYAIGGYDGAQDDSAILSTVEYYDPSTGVSGPWHTLGYSLAAARFTLAATRAPCPGPGTTTCLYAVGGNGVSSRLSSVEYYDTSTSPGTTGTWSTLPAALATARGNVGAASGPCPGSTATTCLYAIGGYDGTNELSSVEYYDLTAGTGGTWQTMTNSMADTREDFGAVSAPCPSSTTTCIYAIGGYHDYEDLSSVEYYDPSSGTGGHWNTMIDSLTTSRSHVGAAKAPCPGSLTTTCLYAIGGDTFSVDSNGYGSGSDLSTVEYYDLSASPTLAVLADAHVQRLGGRLRVAWRLSKPAGVVGFSIDVGGRRVTPRRIPIHASARYRVTLYTPAVGQVTIQVLHPDGSRSAVPVR
jgi:hypothetical protein